MEESKQIAQTITKINTIFNTKYRDEGFLKGTNHYAGSFFTSGACWYYAAMLKKIYPAGDIYISDSAAHVTFKYGNLYYDAMGLYGASFAPDAFCDKEVIGSPAFDHPEHKNIEKLIDALVEEIKTSELNQTAEGLQSSIIK